MELTPWILLGLAKNGSWLYLKGDHSSTQKIDSTDIVETWYRLLTVSRIQILPISKLTSKMSKAGIFPEGVNVICQELELMRR